MKLGDLFVQLGVHADTLKIKEFVKSLGEIPVEVAGDLIALAGLEFKFYKLAGMALETSVGFERFTNATGLSWKELQRWQIVAEQANVPAEAVASSVEALQKNLAEIKLGRGNISPFQLLGISANQDAFHVLEQLRGKIQGLDRATASNMISQMGLSPDMMNVLTLSDQKFRAFTKTVTGMTEQQEEAFLHSKLALTQLGMVFKHFTFSLLGNLAQGFFMLVDKLKEFHYILPAIGVAIAALGAFFAPVTAAVVGLLLVLDDLSVYFRGGKSVTGSVIEGLKNFEKSGGKKLAAAMSGIGMVSSLPFGPLGSLGGVAKLISQANKIDIHVHGSTSAEDTAKHVKKELERGINAAALQVDKAGH